MLTLGLGERVEEQDMGLALWKAGGMGPVVVRVVPVLATSILWLACSSSSPTGATDGAGQPEVWEIKTNDIRVDGGLSDLLDLRSDVPEFDVRVDPETCTPANAGTGCPCDTNPDCLSGWCVFHFGDKVCSKTCVEECPEGWSCEPASGPDPVSVCKSLYPSLCLPCTKSDDCKDLGGGKCVVYGPEVGSLCGAGCDEGTPCPAGYECKETETTEGQTSSQCMLVEGECSCTDYAIAEEAQTGCTVTNEFGACPGWRVCSGEGLSGCSAATPAEETCDGVDNDCDGDADDGDLCEDGNECTKDLCQTMDGCVNEPLDGVACFDGDTCTYDDHCEAGVCVGLPLDCDDGNPCTDDDCGPPDGCIHEDNSLTCEDDGDPCTEDICSGGDGKCEGGESPEYCIVDCSGCGDAVCGLNESPGECPVDCPVPSLWIAFSTRTATAWKTRRTTVRPSTTRSRKTLTLMAWAISATSTTTTMGTSMPLTASRWMLWFRTWRRRSATASMMTVVGMRTGTTCAKTA